MNRDLAFFLGCLTAQGVINRHHVLLPLADRALLARLQSIVREQFGLACTIVSDHVHDSSALQINSRLLCTWLVAGLGVDGSMATRDIPTSLLRASLDEIAAFLRGLLQPATLGSASLSLSLASERLARQCQVLLLNLGVLASVRQASLGHWSLSVHGDALEALARLVGLVQVWPASPQEVSPARQVERLSGFGYPLPSTLPWPASSAARLHLLPALDHRPAAGVARPQPIASSASSSLTRFIAPIQSVTVGFSEVFDISVPGSHSFIANGIGNHNTCNFSPEASREDVGKAYMMAWELGCKGLTVYVTGSRQEVVLETKATADAKKGSLSEPAPNGTTTAAEALQATVLDAGETANGHNGYEAPRVIPAPSPFDAKRPRPRHLHGTTYRRLSPLGTAYVTVNDTEDGEPFEVFMNVGKAGSDVAAVSEALGRLISLVVRLPSSLSPTERLQQVVYQLNGIGGGRHLGFGPQRVRSLPDAIAQVLAEHLAEAEHVPPPASAAPAEQLALPMPKQIGDLCPDCGNSTLLNVEGCRKCHVCGYSEC